MSISTRVFSAVTVLAAVACLPSTALAFADVRGSAEASHSSPPAVIVNEPTVATLTVSDGAASIFGYANTSAGLLRAFAVATYVPGTPYASDVSATVLEPVTFLSGFGTTAYLDYSFDGTITLAGHSEAQATFAQMIASANGILQYTTLAPDNSSNPNSFPCGAGCVRGTSIAMTGSLAFIVGPAPTNIGASLEVYTQYGNSADFSNTAKIYLRLDPSVTFSSGSGSFLSEATPIFGVTAVPEPETYALMLAGLGAMAAVARRRRARR